MQIYKKVHGVFSRAIVFRLNCNVSQSIKTYKILVLSNEDLLVAVDLKISIRTIDYLEELVEAFYLSNRDLLEVDIGRIAQDLGEEVNSFNLIEQMELLALTLSRPSISVLVDPLQEESLIRVEVWLLYEESPETVNVFTTQSYSML